jgi:hypothetical protein
MSEVPEFVSSEFDIFARERVQMAIRGNDVVHYNHIARVDRSDLKFLIPDDHGTYFDLDIKLLATGKLTRADGKDLDATDFTA